VVRGGVARGGAGLTLRAGWGRLLGRPDVVGVRGAVAAAAGVVAVVAAVVRRFVPVRVRNMIVTAIATRTPSAVSSAPGLMRSRGGEGLDGLRPVHGVLRLGVGRGAARRLDGWSELGDGPVTAGVCTGLMAGLQAGCGR